MNYGGKTPEAKERGKKKTPRKGSGKEKFTEELYHSFPRLAKGLRKERKEQEEGKRGRSMTWGVLRGGIDS